MARWLPASIREHEELIPKIFKPEVYSQSTDPEAFEGGSYHVLMLDDKDRAIISLRISSEWMKDDDPCAAPKLIIMCQVAEIHIIIQILVMLSILPLDTRSSSESLPVSEWLSITTLCLAPLIVHIVAGVPHIVHLQPDSPRWHDEICFYNPTTIIWRYLAVTDQRVRSKQWNAVDMAASNMRFWTRNGWDGSEEMMVRSCIFCTHAPKKARMDFCSKVAAETIIVTLQGVQALLSLANSNDEDWVISLATVFFTLAVVGLLRLPAAYWISDEGSFVDYHSQIRREFTSMDDRACEHPKSETGCSTLHTRKNNFEKPCPDTLLVFHPQNNWRTWSVKIPFLTFILTITIFIISTPLATSRWLPIAELVSMSVTGIVMSAAYSLLMTSMFLVIGFYTFRKESTTTIIPCIQHLWYKIYTLVVFVAFLAVIVLAALETRKSSCGVYTTTITHSLCKRR
ncbi:hypothetical protein HYFRA_00003977 [Hymenoscyphus fraxineus]|uniref:Uncharacterized protein n=1 Tax=Hymenoscyphus fraxineus TaxID=746836 RepID=A0A9N9PVD8_9HELO|nr:hypothetical protein HYFRA_00003977 [Hymenoscyphus fraxineus]